MKENAFTFNSKENEISLDRHAQEKIEIMNKKLLRRYKNARRKNKTLRDNIEGK